MAEDPTNPALIYDLAEAASFFAQAAVNSLATPALLQLADLIASRDAAIEVRVQLDPFIARVFILPANGSEPVEVGSTAGIDDCTPGVQH